MNKKLQEAQSCLLQILNDNPDGLTMEDILKELQSKIGEPELRAAVWTLRAAGAVDFDNGKLKALQTA